VTSGQPSAYEFEIGIYISPIFVVSIRKSKIFGWSCQRSAISLTACYPMFLLNAENSKLGVSADLGA
jgi:hypothetical protein